LNKLIFIVDDEKSILKLLSFWVGEKWGYRVKTFKHGQDMLDALSEDPDAVLLDIMLPDINGVDILKKIKQKDPELPVIMLSAQGSVEVALDSLKLGAFDYFPKPLEIQKLEPALKNAVKNYDLVRELRNLKEDLIKKYSFDNIISSDDKMQEVFKLVSKVLDNDITVLIQGESGTGKELIARAIHFNGSRKEEPFIVVNCASIPRELLESELFGHEKGAFTGAHQKKIGKFELAYNGTIFLDEIGDMEMSLQAKILRVLQNKEFERVGGTEMIYTNARVITATNKDLKDAVENDDFREDLYYRISSFPINLPPLRERRGDIVVLVNHFIQKSNEKLNKNVKGISKKAMRDLYDYDWPGNIRELENTIERCVILCDGDEITDDLLPGHIKSKDPSQKITISGDVFPEDAPIVPFEKLKEEAIRHALKLTDNNIVEASKRLQIGRATLYRLMEKYDIDHKKNEG
jgi:DNA-binding NtrC family response regulator